jgi:hypothetical protein
MSQSNSSFEKSMKPTRNNKQKEFTSKPKDKNWQRNNDKRQQGSV